MKQNFSEKNKMVKKNVIIKISHNTGRTEIIRYLKLILNTFKYVCIRKCIINEKPYLCSYKIF